MTEPKYRPCVGVMLLNGAGLAFVGRRRPKGPHDFTNERFEWQMPQGGVDEGEAPVDAALRELETSGEAEKLFLKWFGPGTRLNYPKRSFRIESDRIAG